MPHLRYVQPRKGRPLFSDSEWITFTIIAKKPSNEQGALPEQDINKLKDSGWIEWSEDHWELTQSGITIWGEKTNVPSA